MVDANGDRYRAPALDKGLDIIELLAASPHSLSQIEIAKGLKRGPNEIYRMLDTLVRRGYVARSPEGDKYTLSMRLLAVANLYPPHRRMLDICEPLMRSTASQLEQSVHLTHWESGEFRIVASFPPPGNWRLSLRVGSRIGFYNTGSAKIIAAFQTVAMRERMIAEHRLVENETAMAPSEFHALLDRIKTAGHVHEDSSHTIGVTNISCPLLDPFGNAMAALTSPYIQRIDSQSAPEIDTAITILSDAASKLSCMLNGEKDVPG